jgi:hypothetical protein
MREEFIVGNRAMDFGSMPSNPAAADLFSLFPDNQLLELMRECG